MKTTEIDTLLSKLVVLDMIRTLIESETQEAQEAQEAQETQEAQEAQETQETLDDIILKLIEANEEKSQEDNLGSISIIGILEDMLSEIIKDTEESQKPQEGVVDNTCEDATNKLYTVAKQFTDIKLHKTKKGSYVIIDNKGNILHKFVDVLVAKKAYIGMTIGVITEL